MPLEALNVGEISMKPSGPMMYWEDFEPGMAFELGRRSLNSDEIIRIGKEFDPQIFHVDPVAARETHFGGLVASGWHTVGVFMKMYVSELVSRTASIAGLGIDNLRFLEPVRPDDMLIGRATVISLRPSQVRPEAGVLVMGWEMVRDDGVMVMEARCPSLVLRRTS